MQLKEIVSGASFSEVSCFLKEFKKNGDRFYLTLTDSEISMKAYCSTNLYDYEQISRMKGNPVTVSGYMEAGLEGVKEALLKLKSIDMQSFEKLLDVVPHIAPERLDGYIETIRKYANAVVKPAYRELLGLYFSEENLKIMRTMPATHVRQGSLWGGMLQATCAVTEMAFELAHYYLRNANNIYSFPEKSYFDWDLLITGGLMHLAGNLLYFEQELPHMKRASAIEQSFSDCRNALIYNYVYTNGIVMESSELSALIGVMSRLNEQHNGIKKCRQEADILYSAYSAFERLDAFDYEVSELVKNTPSEELSACMFSEHLHCYISEAELKRKEARLRNQGKE